MRHPTDGTLRRLVDDPAGVPDADRAHVAGCPTCLGGLAAAQQDATAVATALHTEAQHTEVDRAFRQLSVRLAADGRSAAPVTAPRPRRRPLRSPVVAALGVVLVLGGASAAAAGDWLQVFSADKVVAVQVSSADLVALPDMSAYGELELVADPDVHEVPDAAAAQATAHLPVPEVDDLPAGVTGEPTYTVGGQLVVDFTFSADRAAQAATASGEPLPAVPAGLDGSRFRLSAGPGVAATWQEARGVPALVVARVAAPTASSASGVSFETAREYLLTVPGLPDDLAAQLRAFPDGDSTLPVPVPAELVTTSTADVSGSEATVLASRDGSMTGVVWVADGVVTAVGGTLGEDEVLAVARGLR